MLFFPLRWADLSRQATICEEAWLTKKWKLEHLKFRRYPWWEPVVHATRLKETNLSTHSYMNLWTMQTKESNYEICAVLLTRANTPRISAIEIMRGSTTMYSNVEYSDMARCEWIANKRIKNDNIHVWSDTNKCFQLQPSLSKHVRISGLWMHVLKH